TALLNTTTRGSGAGGQIDVNVPGDVTLDGAGKVDFTGIRANSEPTVREPGQGGSGSITAGLLNVYNGAGVATITSGAKGGGKITVSLTSTLRINGSGGGDTGLNAMSVGAGANGGDIVVTAAGGIEV